MFPFMAFSVKKEEPIINFEFSITKNNLPR